jgi:hypothetical protein
VSRLSYITPPSSPPTLLPQLLKKNVPAVDAAAAGRFLALMPECSRCGERKDIHEFSDAQLCRKIFPQCLACSNPRLHDAKMYGSAPQPRRAPDRPIDTNQLRECSACRRHLSVSRFSKRQLAGAGRCSTCTAKVCAANEQSQAEASCKRRREGEADWVDLICAPDPAEERYVCELLEGMEEARRASIAAARRLSSEESAARAAGPLDDSNLGHRMLERLGWEPGTGLGARQDGQVLPIAIELPQRRGTSGLGRSAGQGEQVGSGAALSSTVEVDDMPA